MQHRLDSASRQSGKVCIQTDCSQCHDHGKFTDSSQVACNSCYVFLRQPSGCNTMYRSIYRSNSACSKIQSASYDDHTEKKQNKPREYFADTYFRMCIVRICLIS